MHMSGRGSSCFSNRWRPVPKKPGVLKSGQIGSLCHVCDVAIKLCFAMFDLWNKSAFSSFGSKRH